MRGVAIRTRRVIALTLLTGAAAAGSAREAAAVLSACTAADIIAQNAADCPNNANPCTISKIFNIGDGCTLDFGTRSVTIKGGTSLVVGGGAMTLKSGAFTISGDGFIDARGDGAAPNDHGGMVTILATGAVNILKIGAPGRIDVSGNLRAGAIRITAGGTFTLDGSLLANNLQPTAGGGSIVVDAVGDVVSHAVSVIQARANAGVSGSVDIRSGGKIDLGTAIDLPGQDGGSLSLDAGTSVIVRGVMADAFGDGGSGGDLSVAAGTSIQSLGVVSARGTRSIDGLFGGSGGTVDLDAGFGAITIAANLFADGASPDGPGGLITLTSVGAISTQAGMTISARGGGLQSCGGELCASADGDILSGAVLDFSGGAGGGTVDMQALGSVTVNGLIQTLSSADRSLGGDVRIDAGTDGIGNLTVNAIVDATGGGCDTLGFCGLGGLVDLSGCDVTVASTGTVRARGGDGGATSLIAREQLRVQGVLDATKNTGPGVDGTNVFDHTNRKSPIITGSVTPAATVHPRVTCTGLNVPANCLGPCPACGNGVVEFPETCDTVGTPVSCDGCSRSCRIEICNDNNMCTSDSCDTILGCYNVPVANGTNCSDGLVCNGVESCIFGRCAGAQLNCADTNPCTIDSCTEPGGCQHANAPNGTTCTDSNACTLGDACNASGTCISGSAAVCNDGRECTTDTCNTATGCVFTPRTGTCTDDGNSCTSDVCSAGNCTHPALANATACSDGAFCTINDTCQTGICQAGGVRDCSDPNPCTTDSCDETSDACVHIGVSPCCGDGVVTPPEQCDDSNTVNTDGCLNTCQLATCGDGVVRAGVEECDLGPGNSNAADGTCRTDCRARRCGDGIVDPLAGEQCEDGNALAGDGCSARCFIEPPFTAERLPGRGTSSLECLVEWAIDRPTLDRNGVPGFKQTCVNGDPACDFGSGASDCVFRVWLCSNNHDVRLPLCTPGPGGVGTLAQIEVKKPNLKSAAIHPEDNSNRNQMLRASAAVLGSTFDICGPRLEVRVPLKAPGVKGTKALTVKGTGSGLLVDVDSLKLLCLP